MRSTLTSSSAKQAERIAREEEGAQEPQPPEKKGKPEKKESSKQRLRRELYEQLYVLVEKKLPAIETLFLQARSEVAQEQGSPRQRQRQEQFVEEFTQDIELVRRGVEQSRRRVCEGKKPSVKTGMPLSVSDPNASFIEKGSWDRTFGYRPQLGFSATNLVTAIIVPEENASDQSQLTAMIEQSIANTTVVPPVVSVDDGYTGAEQLAASGQERVRGEQLEKVLACNAFKIVALRRRREEARKRRGLLADQNQEAA